LRRRLGETYLSLDDPARAAAEYERLLKDDPKDPQALFGMGRALALEGEAARSREVLEKAAEAAPAYAAAHYELALAYRDQGDAERSARHLALYESNQQSAPKEDDPLMAAVDAMKRGAGDYIARAIQLEKAGDLDGAIAAHLEALAVDPAVAQTHVNLVALYGRKSDVAKASGHYRKALELASGQADLHYNFGVLMIENGRLAEARQAFEMAIESNPGYAAAYNNLGQIAEREGDIDLAARRYRRALEAQPNFRLARFHLGRMMLAKHSPNEAAEELERAIEPRDEMTPHVLFALAVAREQMGDREGARKLGGQAQQLARQTGQAELARKIGEDLATLR
jgi:Tfp pilus assembly protein PilF